MNAQAQSFNLVAMHISPFLSKFDLLNGPRNRFNIGLRYEETP